MKRSMGIVLKRTNPAKPAYVILDQHRGIVICSVVREDVCIGACIEYALKEQRNRVAADEVELIALPCILSVTDLLLFHRALEICSRCMPEGSMTPGVFEHVRYLYDDLVIPKLQASLLKKIFLCKLFALLGFYPDEKKFQNAIFFKILTESLDNLWSLTGSMIKERDVEEWLRSCITMHTHDQKLKTLQIGEWVGIV